MAIVLRRSRIPRSFAAGLAAAGLLGALALSTWGDPREEPRFRSRDFDGSESCAPCHPRQYLEWRGSAHAYSLLDPIFVACARYAHDSTGGALGDHCLRCHAPIGVRSGELAPGDDPASAPPKVREGISCETCHRMEAAHGGPVADANFELAPGKTFYGRLHRPQPTSAHENARDEFVEKSESCGSCHDVILGNLQVESSFAEWSVSPFAERGVQCQDCHMLRYSGQAAVGGPFRETLHRHNFPGATLPPRGWPNRGYQLEDVGAFLRTALRAAVDHPCEAEAGAALPVVVWLKNSGTAHNFPGATFRQLWIELRVEDAGGKAVFSSGSLDARGDLMDRHSTLRPGEDEALACFSDYFVDSGGEETPYWFATASIRRSLASLEERHVPYRVPVPAELLGSEVRVRARLLFRAFRPYELRKRGREDLAAELPIWELFAYDSGPLSVVEKRARKTEYRLPGDFERIDEALDALRDGDRLLVEPGVYTVRRPLEFRGKRVEVRSLLGPLRTVIRYDPQVPEEERGSVVAFRGAETRESVLRGFTLEGGAGTLAGGIRRGGGVFIRDASPSLIENRILRSSARGGLGGGISCDGGSPLLEGNEIRDCWADRGGALAISGEGEAVRVIRRGRLEGNIARRGGGIYVEGAVRLRLEGCIAAGNSASECGGAVAASGGARIEIDRGTFVSNLAALEGGFAHLEAASLAPIANSIFWGNAPAGIPAEISYSVVDEDPRDFPGKIASFPLFRDPGGFWDAVTDERDPLARLPRELWQKTWDRPLRWVGGDWWLLPGSPAIDAGDPRSPPDPDDTRADAGAVWHERPLKGFIRGDADGDGRVACPDILGVLARVFLSRPLPCDDAADVDDDGSVTVRDLVLLAAHLALGATAPAAPFPHCGVDPTFGEGLGCDAEPPPCRRDRAPGPRAEKREDSSP